MRRVLLLRVVLLGALLALAASSAGAVPQRAAHDCVRGGELWFHAADGTKLVGHRFGRGTTAVILLHQSEGSLCDWLPYARRLAPRGYFVFAVDFRGYGFSDTPPTGLYRYGQDVAAAVKAVRGLGKRKVFLVGASMGAIAAVTAAPALSPPVNGVVSLSAPRRFRGMDGVAAGRRLRVPVLYVAATQDVNGEFDFAADAKALHRAAAARDKRLVLLPGHEHGIGLVGGSPRAKAAVEGFLKGH